MTPLLFPRHPHFEQPSASQGQGSSALGAIALFWLSGLVLAAGCSIINPPLSSPPPTYRGPTYLHGTIGSLTSIRGHDQQLVSGPGLVVGLPGTEFGFDAPAPYHQWMLDQLRRGGFGDPSIKFGDTNMGAMSPEHIIASGTAAPVMIEGLIPPGAIVGTLIRRAGHRPCPHPDHQS